MRRRRRRRWVEFFDAGGTAHGFELVAAEGEAEFFGHRGEQEAGRAPGRVDLGPVDVLRRGEPAESEAVDGAEEAVVADAEGVVVDVGALESLELPRVVVVGCVQGVALVLERCQSEGEGVP